MSAIIYGGDYNPEQWPEDVWVDDIRLMRESSVNLVSLGVFAWARIQPEEGVFDLDWLDRVVDMLHEGGIGINLATATASPPPWVSRKYPQILPQNEAGATYWHGSRQAYSPTSPIYRRLAAALVTTLAERYASHPAVRMWHVNNEYGCHVNYDFSESAAVAFRDWLRARYDDLDALNAAWGTMFWSQRYTDFDEIVPPRLAPYSVNPTGLLDFKRFTSDALLELYRMERDLIRAAGALQPVTTNFMGPFESVNYRSWAAEVDLIADDSYPDPNDVDAFRISAFSRDLMRGLKPGTPWVLMEQASSAVNWRPSNAPKAPGQMAALSMQAIGRGADGIMFFQWRQSRSGSEKFHSAMLPHTGETSETFTEIATFGGVLADALPLAPSVGARVAILYDWENRWAIGNSDHPVTFDYLEVVQEWYVAVHRQHVTVDIRHPEDDLSSYAVVIAPQLYMMTDRAAENLNSFVVAGGSLLVSAFSDVVDDHDAFLDGGFTTRLQESLGVRVTDFGALSIGPDRGESVAEFEVDGAVLRGRLFAEKIELTHASVLGRFAGGRLAGHPAHTVAEVGKGKGYYVATIPDVHGMRAVTGRIFSDVGVTPVIAGLPERVEAVERDGHLFLINHAEEAWAMTGLSGRQVVLGSEDGALVAPFGWRVLNAAE